MDHSTIIRKSPRLNKGARHGDTEDVLLALKRKKIALKHWVPKVAYNDETGGISVCVEGYRPRSDFDESVLKCWCSTPISERLSSILLLSDNGTYYELNGELGRDAAKNHGYSADLLNAFAHGFPPNWKEILKEFMDIRRNAGVVDVAAWNESVAGGVWPSRRSSLMPRRTSLFFTNNNSFLQVTVDEESSRFSRASVGGRRSMKPPALMSPLNEGHSLEADVFSPSNEPFATTIISSDPNLGRRRLSDNNTTTFCGSNMLHQTTMGVENLTMKNMAESTRRFANVENEEEQQNSFGLTGVSLVANHGTVLTANQEGPLASKSVESVEQVDEDMDTHEPLSPRPLERPSSPPQSASAEVSFPKRSMQLYQWVVRIVRDGNVFVQGYKSGGDPEIPWCSTPIVEALKPWLLRTSTGSFYTLIGSIDRAAAAKQSFTSDFIAAFEKGFPTDWQEIVVRFLQRQRRANRLQVTTFAADEDDGERQQLGTSVIHRGGIPLEEAVQLAAERLSVNDQRHRRTSVRPRVQPLIEEEETLDSPAGNLRSNPRTQLNQLMGALPIPPTPVRKAPASPRKSLLRHTPARLPTRAMEVTRAATTTDTSQQKDSEGAAAMKAASAFLATPTRRSPRFAHRDNDSKKPLLLSNEVAANASAKTAMPQEESATCSNAASSSTASCSVIVPDGPLVKLVEQDCAICQKGDRTECLMYCDGCDKGFHCFCLTPRLDSVPDIDAWYCPECEQNRVTVPTAVAKNAACPASSSSLSHNNTTWVDEVNCGVCRQGDREEDMLLCDTCDQGYHFDCVDPPFRRLPVDLKRWFCDRCDSKRAEKKKEKKNCSHAPKHKVEDGFVRPISPMKKKNVAESKTHNGSSSSVSTGRNLSAIDQSGYVTNRLSGGGDSKEQVERRSRSGRTLKQPLESWHGQRIVYDAHKNPIAVVDRTTTAGNISLASRPLESSRKRSKPLDTNQQDLPVVNKKTKAARKNERCLKEVEETATTSVVKSPKKPKKWSAEEGKRLKLGLEALHPSSDADWEKIATSIGNGRTGSECKQTADREYNYSKKMQERIKRREVERENSRTKVPTAKLGTVAYQMESRAFLEGAVAQASSTNADDSFLEETGIDLSSCVTGLPNLLDLDSSMLSAVVVNSPVVRGTGSRDRHFVAPPRADCGGESSPAISTSSSLRHELNRSITGTEKKRQARYLNQLQQQRRRLQRDYDGPSTSAVDHGRKHAAVASKKELLDRLKRIDSKKREKDIAEGYSSDEGEEEYFEEDDNSENSN